jgi:hypothetical protein
MARTGGEVRRILLSGILLLACSAFGQNVRFTAPFPSVSSSASPFLVANLPPNSPQIAWCHSPANTVPCTNYSQTFQGNGTACPNGAQDTPDPNALTSACQSTGDAQGNVGVWSPAGTYDYTVCIAGTLSCFGPYTVTIGGSGVGGTAITVNGGAFVPSPANLVNGANTTVVQTGSNIAINSSGALPAAIYAANAHGLVGDGITDNSAAARTLLATIGSNPATILFTPGTFAFVNFVFPANVTLDFSAGGSLKTITSSTSPGFASFVNGTSVECGSGSTFCTTPALTLTAGNTLVVGAMPYPGFTYAFTSVTDSCGDQFFHMQTTLANQTRVESLWVASDLIGGSCTITATANGTLLNSQVIAQQFAGMGPIVVADGTGANKINSGTTSLTSGLASITTQSLVIGYGGQPFTAETWSPGASYTQPAGLAGQSATGYMQMEYNLSNAGLTAATATLSSAPANAVYAVFALRPGSATITIEGGIVDPDNHQIFYNATGSAGNINSNGNFVVARVFPEWWGASGLNSNLTINTGAIQAAEQFAWGIGRVNGSGLGIYNKELYLGTQFQLNGPINVYDANGFVLTCANRLFAGLTQTAANQPILNGQSTTYGSINHCGFSNQATDAVGTANVIFDYNGTTTNGDLAPQFLTLYDNSFSGGGLRDVGLLIAPSGGGAQGSNIELINNNFIGFTGAGLQAGGNGIGRNAGRSYAENALSITVENGDFQGNPLYGAAFYGAGFIKFNNVSFEDGFTTQIGQDVYCEATQGPCKLDLVRSESHTLIAGNTLDVENSQIIDQASQIIPGGSLPVTSIVDNRLCSVAWDGKYYQVTVDAGAFGGIGTCSLPLTASSGSSTTVADTNYSVTGAVTIGTFVSGETVTQSVTGSAATIIGVPSSYLVITGGPAVGNFNIGNAITQAGTGATATVFVATPSGGAELFINNLSTGGSSSGLWTDSTTGATFSPITSPVANPASPIMKTTAPSGLPNGSNNWIGGTSGAVYAPSGAPIAEANWTANQFVGMDVSFIYNGTSSGGTNFGCYGLITANTANTITASAGWLTNFNQIECSSPALATAFIVEPAWGSATTLYSCATGSTSAACASTGITMVAQSFDAIGGCNGCTGFNGTIVNTTVPGGQIKAAASATLQNVFVTRPDWFNDGGNLAYLSQVATPRDWTVIAGYTIANNFSTFYKNWSLPALTSTNVYSGPFQKNLGTVPIVWDAGMSSAVSRSVGIGGRSNPVGGDNHLEIFAGNGQYPALFGPPVPQSVNGVNLAGINMNVSCGRSTGSAVGGLCQFFGSISGSSGSTVNADTNLWATIGPNGIQRPAGTFSTLAACTSGLEGTMAAVIDSTTNTWGATITGSGADHVLAYCDGSAWTVAAK